MTQEQIQQAMDAIDRAGVKARKSKESARQFLINAGIIQDVRKSKSSGKKK